LISITPANVANVREVIREDRRRTIQDFYNILELSYGTCQHILSDKLNMRWTAAKFKPRPPEATMAGSQHGTSGAGEK
jgi:hypothetical protein